MPESDAALVRGCRDGNARAWRELVQRYRRLVYGIPRALGLQPADADEVFQLTFAQLLRSLPRLQNPDRLEAWLVTTSRRASLRLRRQESRRAWVANASAGEWPVADEPADVEIERLREGERLRRVVDSLGEPCRALVLGLFSEPPRSYRLLAQELGVAVGSMGAMRARCLERLRLRLLRARANSPPTRRISPKGER